MSKLFNNTTSLNEILEAIQNKAAGGSGTDTSDATVTPATILSGYTAYAKGEKITGTIETKTSSDLTSSGATVTIPAGYYAENMTETISTGKATTPTTTITVSPTISISSTGRITASASASKSITPTITAGYISSGTAGTVTVSGSNTKQLTTKAATTYTPTTSNQTIAASTYLTGVQTIKGDSNLVASNIKSGVSIFGVTGTYEGSISEDLTSEVNTYTAKINELETAITALENELQGKASGGSGSGSLETCTVKLSVMGSSPDEYTIHYINSSQQNTQTAFSGMDLALGGAEILCVKNSYIIIRGITTGYTLSGSCTEIFYNMGSVLVFVSGDCKVAINS